MARNKYIYSLADSSLVIHSGEKGGTFNGAIENLNKGWVPLWVNRTNDKNSANEYLVTQGGMWCNETNNEIDVVSISKDLGVNGAKFAESDQTPKNHEFAY